METMTETTETLEITLRPDADLVEALVGDDERGGAEDTWHGRTIPAAAIPRLERYVEVATEAILARWPHATVDVSGEDLHTGGATPGADVRTDGDAIVIGEVVEEIRQRAYAAACEA